MANKTLQGTTIKTGRQLYKYLLRECEKLPTKDMQQFYKFSVKQSFKQHLSETEPERIQEIIATALANAEWVAHKYKGRKGDDDKDWRVKDD